MDSAARTMLPCASLMHEIGHLLRHPKRRTFVNLADEGNDHGGLEAALTTARQKTLAPRAAAILAFGCSAWA